MFIMSNKIIKRFFNVLKLYKYLYCLQKIENTISIIIKIKFVSQKNAFKILDLLENLNK